MFAILESFLLLGLIFLAIYFEHKKVKFPSFIKKLLSKKLITKEQALNITHFEKSEQVKKWLKQKLITKEQADSILMKKELMTTPIKKGEKAYYISIITAICYVAVGSILLGIIAIVAANYQKIPHEVRVLSTLMGLIAVCCGMIIFIIFLQQFTCNYIHWH